MFGAGTASAQTGDGTGGGGSEGAFDQNDPPPPPDEVPTPDSPPDYIPGPLPDPEPADPPSNRFRYGKQINHSGYNFDHIAGTLYGRTTCTSTTWRYVRVGHPSAGAYYQGTRSCSRLDRHVVVYWYERPYVQGDQIGFRKLYGSVTAPNCYPLTNPVLSIVSYDTDYDSGTTRLGVPWYLTSNVTIHTATCV